MPRRLTGWHITAIFVVGFGIVIAVNMLMATLAVSSFGGVVVENSYVASQDFNKWLAEAEKENELGWKARIGRGGDGRLEVATEGTPEYITATAQLRHPLGKEDVREWKLVKTASGVYHSTEVLPEGRWLIRLTLSDGNHNLRVERPVG